MTIGKLLEGYDVALPIDPKTSVTGLCYDSRKVTAGCVFFALPGVKEDGGVFAQSALENGALLVVAGKAIPGVAPLIVIPEVRAAMGEMSARFYGQPSRSLKVIGITGTNGKTTTAFLCRHILDHSLQRCGLIGTVKYVVGEKELPATHTTPEAPDLQRLLAQMCDEGNRAVAMEVSSHAIAQERIGGIDFNVAVFTNLTQDHLDYHKTMEAYFDTKSRLFTAMNEGRKKGKALINTDDRYGDILKNRLDKLGVTTFSYGRSHTCDFRAGDVTFDIRGAQFHLTARGRKYLVRLPLIGEFNVSNALAAIASTALVGVEIRAAIAALAACPQVPGRLQRVPSKRHFQVFVDYAHTEDALQNTLSTLRNLKPKHIITVVGCGGDRDKAKRPRMAAAAETQSNHSIFTTDNPRSEDPMLILSDMRKGLRTGRYEIIPDRTEAIRRAIRLASDGDIVLIAGKGHETYQEIHGVRTPYDDVKIAAQCIEERPVEIELDEPEEFDEEPEMPPLEEGVQE